MSKRTFIVSRDNPRAAHVCESAIAEMRRRYGARVIDLTGQRFERLTVLDLAGMSSNRSAKWRCRCDCGGEIVTQGKFLRSGQSLSCGCLRKERAAIATRKAKTTHGHTAGTNSRTYRIWMNMISRCTNPRFDSYPYYGGRGISVCERWKTFANFLTDMGPAPDRLTLDRKDSDGDYSPENCRWATKSQQANNTRRNVNITLDGRTQTMSQWCAELGLVVGTVHSRLKRGFSPSEALRPGDRRRTA